jgi:hypothetical protein
MSNEEQKSELLLELEEQKALVKPVPHGDEELADLSQRLGVRLENAHVTS